MSSYEVVERGAAAGIVITASHNPWTDNGFKVKAPTGVGGRARDPRRPRGGDRRRTAARRSSAARSPTPRRPASSSGSTRSTGYERFVRRTVDLDALRAADVAVLVEPMWGAGAGWITRLLGGGRIRVTEIHQERNPYFGGVNPEPIRPHVDEALGMLAGGGYDLGLLLDGDADRAGAADERGTFIHQLQVTGLLMYYLAEHRGLRDPVVDQRQQHLDGRAARRALRDRDVHETSVGFKYIGPKMIETGAMMGAEESGGYGFGMHLPERDGIYADLLLLDLFLRERAAGRWPVSQALAASPRDRRAVVLPAGRRPRRPGRLPGAQGAPAGRAARRTRRPSSPAQPVARTEALDTNDGFKFFIADGSWLLVRFSGTEPLVRVYTEATSPDAARRDDRRRRATGPRRMTDGTAAGRDRLDPDPLDDDARRADLDPGHMAGAIATLGDQLRAVAERLPSIEVPPAPEPWRSVAVLGMGGSAMGADLLRGAFEDRARLPIVVSRSPELPAWVGPSTLVIASSHSGGTAETLAATRAAIERGAAIVAVTSGGEMAALGDAHGTRVAISPGGQPRAALGASAGLVLGVLAAAGVVDHTVARTELLAAAEACDRGTARFGPEAHTAANPAKLVARWLESRIAVVVGGGHMAPVARRWKTQLNENGKTWATWDELPELAHNTLVGLDAAPVIRNAVHVIILHGTETPEAAARRGAVEDELEASGTAHTTLSVEPDTRLAEAFAGIILGDWVSYHLAMVRGLDPTPVGAITRYKARLAAG